MKRSRKSKKNKQKGSAAKDIDEPVAPRSFIIGKGDLSYVIGRIVSDFRSIMMPFTSQNLKPRKKHNIEDYIKMASSFKVSHLIIFSGSKGVTMKIAKLPQGPTISFRVSDFCSKKKVVASLKRRMINPSYKIYPACFMSNLQPLEGDKHLQLCSQMFLSMFPSIHPSTVRSQTIKRCCLVHYDADSELYSIRQYSITFRQKSLSKGVHKLLGRKPPNLASFQSVSDFIENSNRLSASEAEDDPENRVIVKKIRKTEVARQKSSVRLYEMGPRLTLQLIKIESGVCEGDILHHSFIEMSEEEVLARKEQQEKKMLDKRARHKQQLKNAEINQAKKLEHKRKCLEGMGIYDLSVPAGTEKKKRRFNSNDNSEEEDADYFEEVIGEKPDRDMFVRKGKMQKPSRPRFKTSKKKKN